MATTFFLLFIFIFSVLSSVGAQYDYFQMVQQWPPATCSGVGITCNARPPTRFTIHGLWPSFNNTHTRPVCTGARFNATQIATLTTQLRTYWPNVITGNNQWFWMHEWDDHGRCSNPPFNELQYFQTTLNIRTNHNYDLLAILNAAGLGPTGAMFRNYTAIEGAIRAATGRTPGLRCNINARTRNYQLYEIILCFNQNGVTLIDCTQYDGSNCPNRFVWLHRQPLRLGAAVGELKDSLIYHVSLPMLLLTFVALSLFTVFAFVFLKRFCPDGHTKKE